MPNTNIKKDSQPFTWTHEYLSIILTEGKNCIIKNQFLAKAFKTIDRADFVPQELVEFANMDYDLDIGYGCIIHKPTIVAQILQILNPQVIKNCKILDIGTGSGFVAALLGSACTEESLVISLERVQFLTDIARHNLEKYPEISNVKVYLRDGLMGLSEQAPYDFIHISASYEEVPGEISNQLKIGGKMVVPTVDKKVHLIERLSEKEFKETVHEIFDFAKIKTGIE
jgi:protein-L-isoaspartate(D-aspartate) O-methyltransferase